MPRVDNLVGATATKPTKPEPRSRQRRAGRRLATSAELPPPLLGGGGALLKLFHRGVVDPLEVDQTIELAVDLPVIHSRDPGQITRPFGVFQAQRLFAFVAREAINRRRCTTRKGGSQLFNVEEQARGLVGECCGGVISFGEVVPLALVDFVTIVEH